MRRKWDTMMWIRDILLSQITLQGLLHSVSCLRCTRGSLPCHIRPRQLTHTLCIADGIVAVSLYARHTFNLASASSSFLGMLLQHRLMDDERQFAGLGIATVYESVSRSKSSGLFQTRGAQSHMMYALVSTDSDSREVLVPRGYSRVY